MKMIINSLAIIPCFVLAVSLAHADSWERGGAMHDQPMHDGVMQDGTKYGHMESRIFKEVDANGDGAISRAEFDAFHANRFKEMDTNGDGKITLDEMKSAHKSNLEKRKGKWFDEADANHDGALSREEAEKMPRMSKRFDEMDANHDGKVMRKEMEAAMKKMRRDRGEKKDDEKKRPD